MDFVNLHGKPLDVASMAAPQRRSSRPAPASYHKGRLVTGFPPDAIKQAEQQHAELVARNAASGRSTLPWDVERYIRTARPHKVRAKPYETEGAADAAVALARRTGWIGVTATEVAKGAK